MLYIEKVIVGDDEYSNVPAESLREIGVSEEQAEALIAEASAKQSKLGKSERIRSEIQSHAGDNASLLGTAADGVQLLLFAFSQMTVALKQASSLAEVREAAAPFNDLAISFLSKVESGDVKLPFQAKGLESVVSDIETRATAVTEVLVNNG